MRGKPRRRIRGGIYVYATSASRTIASHELASTIRIDAQLASPAWSFQLASVGDSELVRTSLAIPKTSRELPSLFLVRLSLSLSVSHLSAKIGSSDAAAARGELVPRQ